MVDPDTAAIPALTAGIAVNERRYSMFQQDYIIRQIQQLTHALEQVLFKKKQQQYQEARQIIHEALNELPDQESSGFHELPPRRMLSIFEQDGTFNADLGLAAAELLLEEADLTDNAAAAGRCRANAFLLYRKSIADGDVAVSLQTIQKIDHIRDDIQQNPYWERIKNLLPPGPGQSGATEL